MLYNSEHNLELLYGIHNDLHDFYIKNQKQSKKTAKNIKDIID